MQPDVESTHQQFRELKIRDHVKRKKIEKKLNLSLSLGTALQQGRREGADLRIFERGVWLVLHVGDGRGVRRRASPKKRGDNCHSSSELVSG